MRFLLEVFRVAMGWAALGYVAWVAVEWWRQPDTGTALVRLGVGLGIFLASAVLYSLGRSHIEAKRSV
ncbi:MAG: hypothetical protein ACRDM7_03930 [Thermoleophilaceae bacterium]